MGRNLSEFTGLYQVAETLKFELRPIGKTEEHIKNSGLLESDFRRAEDYPKVKQILDDQHKQFLQRVLSDITFDWQPLADALTEFQKDKSTKAELEKTQKIFRKKVVELFTKDDFYALLVESTPSKLLKKLLSDNAEPSTELKTFAQFACYFEGFQENRRNIYSSEPQQTAAAFRAVNENFSRFFNASNILKTLCQYPDLVRDMFDRTHSLRGGKSLEDLFQTASYNQFIAQSGIDFFNQLVGEINYAINQYRQQHKDQGKLPLLPTLQKQILSDREATFIVEMFQDDTELCSALSTFSNNCKHMNLFGDTVELFSSLRKILSTLTEECNLYIDAKHLDKISQKVTGSWSSLQEAMETFVSTNIKGKTNAKKYCDQEVFHLSNIKSWNVCKADKNGQLLPVNITSYWNGEYAAELFDTEYRLYPAFEKIISQPQKNLRDDDEKINIIKEYLDAVQEIYHLLKPLILLPEYDGDQSLMSQLKAHKDQLELIIPLYNKVRNYAQKKVKDEGKIKLMFDKPTFGGWAADKLNAYLTVILKEDKSYYLGIIHPKAKVNFSDFACEFHEDCYQKLEFNQYQNPGRGLPTLIPIDGVVVRKTKSLEELKQRYYPEEINRIRLTESFKVGEAFSKQDLTEYIAFYQKLISEYKPTTRYCFKKACDYSSWDEFTKDVEIQSYNFTFTNISKSAIKKLVDEGKLYLFQIYNKDFSEYSWGTPNKFTLFWNALFALENLSDVVFKLNGSAALFLRKQAIEAKITHQTGEKLVNRTIVTDIDQKTDRAIRETIPQEIHQELYLFVNGKCLKSHLSKATLAFMQQYDLLYWEKGMSFSAQKNKIIIKTVQFDIVKDKRYTEDKYFFHVPILINFKAPEKPIKFNDRVLEYLRNNPDVKIIGLDRGERNLIYLTLIDQQGNILKQMSLNLINGVNYQGKLDLREKERQHARRSWKTIGKIKDLKSGYLSAVVYEIVRMMVRENAIVAMEDLNIGFKRGRMKIEKQIYQQFERMLLEKLNYLVFKKENDLTAPGGVLAGYQLAEKFESFQKMGKQCGFVFYVPAGFTSKIDPATGFVNIFNMKNCTNAENIKDFFNKFTSIYYSAEHDAFAFSFDYRNFKTYQSDHQNEWTIYTVKEAWQQEKDSSSGNYLSVRHNPTEEIKTALQKAGIELKDKQDLLSILRQMEACNSTASFFNAVFHAFKLSVSLRHRSTDADKIISPVLNQDGKFFVSEERENNPMPQDADANGAFHIALKGLYLLLHCIPEGNDLKISNEEWFKFAQTRNS